MIKLCAFIDEAATDLQGQMQAMKRNDLDLIEVRNINGVNVASFSLENAREYKRVFDDNGVSAWSIGSPLGKVDINTPFNDYEKTIRHIFEIANIFKTDKVRAFSFFNAYDQKEKVYDYLNKMVLIAKEYGVNLYHENEKEIYGDTAERVLDIMQNVNGLKYIYDPANFLQVGDDADKTLSLLHQKTDYFHIKDVISSTQELVPAGFGDGKIDKLINMIDKDVVLTLEPHLAIFSGYANIDNTEMKNKFTFSSNKEAFDTAVNALKKILLNSGYEKQGFNFIKKA